MNSNSFLKLFKSTFIFLCFLFYSHTTFSQVYTVTYQPHYNEGEDALFSNLINCSTPIDVYNFNFGTHPQLTLREWTFNTIPQSCSSGTTRSFIRFAEAYSLPSNAEILEATLYLYADPGSEANYAPNSFQIGGVTSNWDDDTLTWANSPNVDYSYNLVHPSSSSSHQDVAIDVTPIVQDQYQSGNHFGFGLKLVNEVIYSRWTFASSNHHDSKRHPKLEITYSVHSILDCNANFSYLFDTEDNEFTFIPNEPDYTSYNYYWQIGDTTTLYNDVLTYSFTNPGTYDVCLNFTDTIFSCAKCIELCVTEDQVNSISTSIGDGEFSNIPSNHSNIGTLKIYPNPAQNDLHIKLNSMQAGKGRLAVYDISGKKLVSQAVTIDKNDNHFSIEVSSFSAGVYVCEIQMNGEAIQDKLVIIK